VVPEGSSESFELTSAHPAFRQSAAAKLTVPDVDDVIWRVTGKRQG
jgi:hypothetical protein